MSNIQNPVDEKEEEDPVRSRPGGSGGQPEDVETFRVNWLEERVFASQLSSLRADKFRKLFRSDDNLRVMNEFFEAADTRCLLISGDKLVASHNMPSMIQGTAGNLKDAFFCLKSGTNKITKENISTELICGELSKEPLAHLAQIIQDVYMPLLSNPANQEGFGEVQAKEIQELLHGFLANVSITLGQTRGETCLPLPLSDSGGNVATSKDKIHLLEGAVITWTKQIKNILKQDSEGLLKLGLNPTPDQEIEFWRSKAANLNSIYEQLQSDKIRRVLKFLDSSKSTYCTPFAKLCKEVFSARFEANDNILYLQTLEKLFSDLNNTDSDEFPGIVKLFKPIMHTILLIWKHSKFYNIPSRLVVLMREICNSLINQACKFISGKQIFELIENEEASKAVEQLKLTLKVCGTFKSTYFDYKATANSDCPTNPWRIQNNALFMRLDSFLERCHDILDLSQTIVQFSKLSKIEVGGTKGKTLTTSVVQVYSDFRNAVECFQQVDYDIMDVSAKKFDDHFYEFRCKIKELERRLGSVLTQGFDDSATIHGRFKLLDSFEGLLERPIIQDELEKKHLSLVQSYGQDLKLVQELLITLKDDPPRPVNMPPSSGAIYWCNGLLDRITEPMDKLKQLNRAIMEREEAKEVIKMHATAVESLSSYRKHILGKWATDVDSTAAAKLKLPLLRYRNVKESTHQQQIKLAGGFSYKLLEVNFDPALIALLREVKYFLLLEIDVPEFALELNKKETLFRNWRGKLQLCVNKYNNMMTSMLPVECPLVRTHVEKIHQVVDTGLNMLTWKSHGIDNFIEKAVMAVNDACSMLNVLKSNLGEIENILDSWAEANLLDRQSKPVSIKEYNNIHKQRISAHYQKITEGGKQIHKFVKDSNKVLRISAGHPEWRAYVDFVNAVLIAGLTRVVKNAFKWLNEQVQKPAEDDIDKGPMLNVDVNLDSNIVSFIPSVLDDDRDGVRASVRGWIEDVMKIGMLIKRLDLGEGTYVRELQSDTESLCYLAKIYDNLAENETECSSFKEQYEKYSFLWTTDLSEMFSSFLEEAVEGDKINLDKFDQKMVWLNEIKDEVASLKTPTTIGWLKVNSVPIKENICYWCNKWFYLVVHWLRNHLVSNLQELRNFIIYTKFGLEREVAAGDTDTLMSVMGNIRDVKKRMDSTVQMIDPLKSTVSLLKTHRQDIEDETLTGISKDRLYKMYNQESKENESSSESGFEENLLDFLDSAGLRWDSLVNFTFGVKEKIIPLQNQEIESINVNLQNFKTEVEVFRKQFKDDEGGAPMSFTGSAEEAYEIIEKFQKQYEEKMAKANELNSFEELFELQITKYRTLLQTKDEILVLKKLWDFNALQHFTYTSWNSITWKLIDTDLLEDTNKSLLKQLKQLGNEYTICRAWDVYKNIEQRCKDMSIVLPLISELHSPAMRARHWKAIAAACKVQSIPWNSDRFCFANLLDLHLQDHADDVSEQVETAEKELKIEKKLEIIESRWETLKLDWIDVEGNPVDPTALPEENDSSNVYLPRPSDDVVENLESDQMELQSMIGMGKFVKYFKEKVTKWSHTLSSIEENLKDWLNVSKQWCSLETIFLASEDIRRQLPDDTKRFEGIDAEFKELEQRSFAANPLVVQRCTEEGLNEALKKMLVDLAKCQKSLNEYLDTKKKIFPRFYFVSNVALLDILSNGNCPKKILPYLSDCYDSLCNLTFEDEGKDENPHRAVEMISLDGEKVSFPQVFDIKGAVENWLNELTDVQVLTLKTVLKNAIDTAVNWEHEKPRHQWLFDYPAQVVLQGTQVFWTEETEAALEDYEGGNDDAVKSYLDVCNRRLNNLISLVEGDLEKGDRTKIISLITMDVHSRDVLQRLIDEKAEGPSSFLWQQQLRNYWKTVNPNMETDIRICDYKTKYSYEYTGNCGRLVITPLTDRCYITLTTAMRLMLGGAPAGPAGTGKTETTKDLARALALPCYVFNCSDQMNYQTLADIFKGLSQSGGWGCFDEFNRIPIEVLSVVATQVKTILDAVVKYADPINRPEAFRKAAGEMGETVGTPPCKVGTFDFFGDELCLIPTTAFYITMNPGYAGRTELPENLKALFRSCAMIRPDLALICENMLMAEGFQNARALSIKFVTLYELSSNLLSPQPHYDWGLRAVKSVLRVAGMLKRSNPDLEEEPVLMRALRDFNTPKIPVNDMPIFLRLIQDLFPKYADSTPPVIDKDLKEITKEVCKNSKEHLQADEAFVAKVVQFKELLDVRHSVMLIGCAGCGKSTIWKTLQAGLNLIGKKSGVEKNVAIAETVNPKSVTSDELYGYMTLSKDWKDGVLSIMMRGMSKNYRDLGYYSYQSSKWVVLDGDIDAVWIESMNTVMDDNKVLTLVSNERIPLSDPMRMVFEINSLANATPATVSRAGILYINEVDIGWRPYVDSWVSKLESEGARSRLPGMFENFVPKLVDGCRQAKIKGVIHQYVLCKVQTLCHLLQSQLSNWTATGEDAGVLEQIFAFSCIWAFGGCLADDKNFKHRREFNATFISVFPNILKPAEGRTVYDYCLDLSAEDKERRWVLWDSSVEEYVPQMIGSGNGETPFSQIYVNTADNHRLAYFLETLVSQNRPVMFVGSAGTGKSVLCKNWMNSLTKSDENMLTTSINMNYFMDSKAFQQQIEGAIDKRSGRRFGPPGNKKLVCFIDDINLPYVEEYGTQNSIALLTQIMSYGTFFDRDDLGFRKEIVDVKFVSALNPKAGSFTICERAQLRFSTFATNMPTEDELASIFLTIMDGQLSSFSSSVQLLAVPLVNATISLHSKVVEKFLPSAIKFVYTWNMRELANVFQGICRATEARFSDPLKMCRLWVHECSRVYGDRLVDETDISRFEDLLNDVSKTLPVDNFDELHAKPLKFISFSDEGKNYDMVSSEKALKSTVTSFLAEYNLNNPAMDLVLFEDAISHITRITRILEVSAGNAMLVGVGGSGKQSLSKLASFICELELKQMNVTSDFTLVQFLEELQVYVKQAGIKGTPITWLITDQQFVNEKFLVYLNDLVSTGWIPDLFPKEDLPGILDGLKSELRANGMSDTMQDKISLFVSRIKKYLHVIICCSPVGDAFRVRARRFPGLVNCTVVDWFHPWPEDALVSVATRFLSDVKDTFPNDETLENVAYHMSFVHQEVIKASKEYALERRYNYVTPKSFLEFISFYKNLLGKKRENADYQIERLQNGLDVLKATASKVEDLKEDLKLTLGNVEEKKAATEALMERIGVERAEAEEKQEKAAIEQEKAEIATAAALEIEKSASAELAEAQPAMDAAAEAVNCLNKAALTELKSLSKPPAGVDKVTKACLMMIEGETKNFKWDRAKKMMGNIDQFLGSLKSYDASKMDEKLIDKLTPIVSDEGFTFDNMKSKSGAAANLCNWVINVYRYNRIYVKVKPLMDKLEAANKDKSEAEAKLAEVQSVVKTVEQRLNGLKEHFMQATQDKMKVEEEAEQCQSKLDLANRLVQGLASENERWGVDVEKLKEGAENLIGTVLISAAFVGYIGGFEHSYRIRLWKDEWMRDLIERELPIGNAETLDPLSLLTDDSNNAKMMDEGLPADRISIENGAVITNCTRWPLIIDPQEQGIKWLKSRYAKPAISNQPCDASETSSVRSRKGEELSAEPPCDDDAVVQLVPPKITQITKNNWTQEVSEAIEQGEVIFIENLGEQVDSNLDPVLSRAVVKKGRNKFISFAGKEIGYDDNFKLFMFTKLSNPHYKPELQAQCTLINFIATENGLEDQLLARTVQAERPDKEAEQQKLQSDFNKYKVKLTQLEDNLLAKLANAPDDILSDIPLIEGLEATKEEAQKIGEAVAAGEVVLKEVAKIRESYRAVAAEASMLYFMLTKLNVVSHMYQYSLDAFVQFFDKAISRTPACEQVNDRVSALADTLRFTIFTWVSRGLFEQHKLIFLSQLTFNLMQRGKIDASTDWNSSAFEFLLRRPQEMMEENELSDWLPDSAWNSVQALAKLDDFMNLPNDLLEAAPRFRDWYNHVTPETEKLPLDWAQLDKTPFMKLLVVRCLRPDRMRAAVESFVRSALPDGSKYVDCDSTLNSYGVLEEAYKDSSPAVPIYFVLSPGADVVSDVDRLAVTNGMEKGKSYFNVSMGQGQDKVAEQYLESANQQGHWVILNNVHLMPKWLITLEKMLDNFNQAGSHKNFRLFLSSDPSNHIPIGVLARCIKLTNEPPAGLKANLKRAFCSFPKAYVDEADSKTKSILFGLCQFHSVMMERKKFGPLGFNMMYPFSLGDLRDSAVCLTNYMESAVGNLPWEDLKYIFGEIIYGGHIVNDFDRLMANTYLDFYMKDELLDEMELFPFAEDERGASFKSPSPTTYDSYLQHIEEGITKDTPLAFGMHPNAEIEFRTAQSQSLFSTLIDLQPRSSGGADGDASSPQLAAENVTNEILDRFQDSVIDLELVNESITEKGPFQNVFIQECEAMNLLLIEMKRSLEEITLGFAGELTMSDQMEDLMDSLFLDQVPKTWVKLAWPSRRSLRSWLNDLEKRLTQLLDWTANPFEVPRSTWISGLFNPTSFLTAIKQMNAQRTGAELDKLIIQTEITKFEEVDNSSRDGYYIHGLFMQGARWDIQNSNVEKSKPKEMFCPMPIINCKAVKADKAEANNTFYCPCYKTEDRGPTYVFSAQLKTKAPAARWILAGVALIMDIGN